MLNVISRNPSNLISRLPRANEILAGISEFSLLRGMRLFVKFHISNQYDSNHYVI